MKKNKDEWKAGQKAPDFTLPNQEGREVSLKDFHGKWVVLYFYPKDGTPGCSLEAAEFSRDMDEFKKLNAVVLGASPDPTKSHRNFIQKQGLKVELLSDPELRTLQAYGVWQKKKMAGREYMGVVRSTFLMDPDGKIARVWSSVKAKGHAEEVRKELSEIAGIFPAAADFENALKKKSKI